MGNVRHKRDQVSGSKLIGRVPHHESPALLTTSTKECVGSNHNDTPDQPEEFSGPWDDMLSGEPLPMEFELPEGQEPDEAGVKRDLHQDRVKYYADDLRAKAEAREIVASAEDTGAALLRAEQLRAMLLDSAALDLIPPPLPVIDGFLYRDSLAWLHGKPGHGKSFVALDWAACISLGLPWQEHETVQGPVLYLVAEGAGGIRQRVRAWEDMAQCPMAVQFLPVAIQVMTPTECAALSALVAEMKPALVVLDTQARVTAGHDENSAKDMGLFVAAADRIREASGACVLIVHHEARAGENMRGSTAMEGAATSILRATKEGSVITISTTKQKDIEEAEDIRLNLRPRLDSAVLVSLTGRETHALGSESEATILETLRDSFVRRAATGSDLIEITGLSKATVYRTLSSLVKQGFVENIGTAKLARYVIAGESQSHGLTESHDPSV